MSSLILTYANKMAQRAQHATAEAAIRSMGDLTGKILLDAINPVAMGPDGLGLEIGHNSSAGEKVQAWATGASVFKTLNTTGFGNMADPLFHGVKSVMSVAGDDTTNKPRVIELVASLGFEVVDAGPLRSWRSSVVSAETGPLRLLGEEVCKTL